MSRRDEVDITRVEKKGDYYVVQGAKDGKHVSVDIPAYAIDGKSRKDAEALMRRGIHGTAEQERA